MSPPPTTAPRSSCTSTAVQEGSVAGPAAIATNSAAAQRSAHRQRRDLAGTPACWTTHASMAPPSPPRRSWRWPAQAPMRRPPHRRSMRRPTPAPGSALSPTLSVGVSDPDADPLTVTYFGRPLASGNFTQIAQHTGVASGTQRHRHMAEPRRRPDVRVVRHRQATRPTLPSPARPGPSTRSPASTPSSSGPATSPRAASPRTPTRATSSRASTATSGPPATTSTTTAPRPTSRTATPPRHGAARRSRSGPGRSRATTTGAPATPNSLAGYIGYYGANATDANGKSYYSYDIAGSNWHIVNLDSECALVPGGCDAGSAAGALARADLAANSTQERDRRVAQAALQLGRDQPTRRCSRCGTTCMRLASTSCSTATTTSTSERRR